MSYTRDVKNAGIRVARRATKIVEDVWDHQNSPDLLVRAAPKNQLKELSQLALVVHSESKKINSWAILPNPTFKAEKTTRIVTNETHWHLGEDEYLRPKELKILPAWEAEDWYNASTLIESASKYSQ